MKAIITIKDMITELEKFEDQDQPLCVIASTNPDEPDAGENFIDGSGVKRIKPRVINFSDPAHVEIVVGDTGAMTVREVIDALKTNPAQLDPVRMRIGYQGTKLRDANDGVVRVRDVVDCAVLPGDTIWNITLH